MKSKEIWRELFSLEWKNEDKGAQVTRIGHYSGKDSNKLSSIPIGEYGGSDVHKMQQWRFTLEKPITDSIKKELR